MTTTINDISDLARILEERPEWAETLRSLLLAREVLDLPTVVTSLTAELRELTTEVRGFIAEQREINARADARVDAFIAEQREINARADARVDAFIAEQREINARADARVDAFIAEQREINARADARMDALTAELREFVRETREHNQRMDQEMEQTRQQMDGLDQTILEIREQNRQMNQRLDRFGDQMGRVLGDTLENQLHTRIIPILADRFNLRRPRIVKSRFFQIEPALLDLLEAAEEAGSVSIRQLSQLQLADFILRAQRKDTRDPVYVVVESSRTVNERDITRARERADTLSTATGVETLAVAVGNFVPEPQERQAADWGVTIIAVAEPEDE